MMLFTINFSITYIRPKKLTSAQKIADCSLSSLAFLAVSEFYAEFKFYRVNELLMRSLDQASELHVMPRPGF